MTETDFIATIAEDPDDDGAWLVFADWLEEQGDVRGEYLRLVVEIERRGLDEARAAGLVEQLSVLTREATIVFPGDAHRRFAVDRKRGLVVGVRMSGAELVEQGGAVFAASPVRALEVFGIDRHAGAISRAPFLERLRTLGIVGGNKRIANVTEVLRSPHLRKLEHLNLNASRIGRGTFEAIRSLRTTLRTLTIHDWRWDPAWLDVLVGAASLRTLERLDLSHSAQLDDESLPTLMRIMAAASEEIEVDLRSTSINIGPLVEFAERNGRGTVFGDPPRP